MSSHEKGGWKIDRHIPVAVIVTLLLQMCAVLIWATELDARVGNVERIIGATNISEKLARLEERLDSMKQDTGAMKRQLDYLTDRLIRK